MKNIKVLGSGCRKCVSAAKVISEVASELGVDVMVIKETDPEVIMNYGVMSTPAVVVDEEVVHTGSVPNRSEIETWLKN